jgi:hypothetical protein
VYIGRLAGAGLPTQVFALELTESLLVDETDKFKIDLFLLPQCVSTNMTSAL